MKHIAVNFQELPVQSSQLEKNSNKISLGQVIAGTGKSYLDIDALFIAHFNTIPNFVGEANIDCVRAYKWFSETYKPDIKDWHYGMRNFCQDNTTIFDDVYQILYEDEVIVNFDMNYSRVRILFGKKNFLKIDTLITGIQKFRKKKVHKPHMSLLVNTIIGIETKTMEISRPKLNIRDNYNDDFVKIHRVILKRLAKKNGKGVVILHGKPGTGKTSYIRYLISLLKKEIIFLPPNMTGVITNPDLISILIDHPDSILIIEDAENIVLDREKMGDSPISALLNITDGLLSDCLNIQVVCSFNTDISKVDSALMRKGRLIATYEFKELETQKAQALSDKLLFNSKIYKPMTLTEIYNQEDLSFQQTIKRNAIGFMATNH
jgi:ATPase family associated with various cellular activities (AAA)